MTAQEIFDKVVAHLAAQKLKSINQSGLCAYRGEYGTMCAVGCLIPDEVYDHRIEGVTVHTLFRVCLSDDKQDREAVLPGLVAIDKLTDFLSGLVDHKPLLGDLQNTHDGGPIETWRRRLETIAQAHGLSFDEQAFSDKLFGTPQ